MGLNEVTAGMTPQEKEIYFAHMEKRHREEAEKIRLEKERTRAYKESLIQDILAKGLNHNQKTEKQLRGRGENNEKRHGSVEYRSFGKRPLSHEYFHGKVQKPQERHHEVVGSGQWQTYDYPRRNKKAVYHTDSGRICGHHGRSQRHHAESF